MREWVGLARCLAIGSLALAFVGCGSQTRTTTYTRTVSVTRTPDVTTDKVAPHPRVTTQETPAPTAAVSTTTVTVTRTVVDKARRSRRDGFGSTGRPPAVTGWPTDVRARFVGACESVRGATAPLCGCLANELARV